MKWQAEKVKSVTLGMGVRYELQNQPKQNWMDNARMEPCLLNYSEISGLDYSTIMNILEVDRGDREPMDYYTKKRFPTATPPQSGSFPPWKNVKITENGGEVC